MASINASTSGPGGIITSGDTSGNLELQSGGSAIATVSSTGLSLASGKTFSVAGVTSSPYAMKNRIINGDIVIDQRNAGASVTPTDDQYVVDRFFAGLTQASKFSLQQSTDAPTGFVNSLKATSLSAYSVGASDTFLISQNIEGLNCSDLAWGTASAKTVTLSFWVKSSLTGTFGGTLKNSAANRSYPFSYTISAANTWEQKSVTIAGDTTGTWLTTDGIGIRVIFGLGGGSTFSGTAGAWTAGNLSQVTGGTSVVGTNGATFYITGVQLEVGSSATSFEWLSYGTELALCQRYCLKLGNDGNFYTPYGSVTNTTTTTGLMLVQFPTTMRAIPTLVSTAPNRIISGSVNNSVTSIVLGNGGTTAVYCDYVSTGLTIGQSGWIGANGNTSSRLLFSAEL